MLDPDSGTGSPFSTWLTSTGTLCSVTETNLLQIILFIARYIAVGLTTVLLVFSVSMNSLSGVHTRRRAPVSSSSAPVHLSSVQIAAIHGLTSMTAARITANSVGGMSAVPLASSKQSLRTSGISSSPSLSVPVDPAALMEKELATRRVQEEARPVLKMVCI